MSEEIISNSQFRKIASEQKAAGDVLDLEYNRLVSKKANMDAEIQNANRMILLNQTYRDRQKKYLILLTLFILTFGACLFIVFLQERLGYSSAIMDWILVFIVAIGFISAYFLYQNILSRDKIDFSKIQDEALIDPKEVDESYEDAAKKGDISTLTVESCKNEACCGPGYEYKLNNDGDKKECRPI
jgi:hypothetical protein